MSNSWFKFFGADWLSDPKRKLLTPAEQNCFTVTLSYAQVLNKHGRLPNLTEEAVMEEAGIKRGTDEWEKTKGVMEKFMSLGMIVLKNGLFSVKNWKKRQSQMSESYERVKKWREEQIKRYSNATDTLHDNGKNKNRIDKNRKEKNTYTPLFEEFWKEYPPTRKQDKPKCASRFSTYENEGIAKEIISDVIDRKLRHTDWVKDNGRYVPAPLVYLNNRRWEAPIVEETQLLSFKKTSSTVIEN